MFTSKLVAYALAGTLLFSVISLLYYKYTAGQLTISKLESEVASAQLQLNISNKANAFLQASIKVNAVLMDELNTAINNLRDDNTQFQNELAASNEKDYLSCTIPNDVRKLLERQSGSKHNSSRK